MKSSVVTETSSQVRKKCYDSILRLYEKFQGESIENLFDEVYNQENETIPFKYRKIKK